MKKKIIFNILLAAFFLLAVLLSSGNAADFTLKWTAPTKNTDGSTIIDLAGYRVYYGTATNVYLQAKGSGINVPGAATLSYTVTGLLTDKTYYFAVTAYDTANNESAYSNEVSGIKPTIPGAPTITIYIAE